MIDNLGVLKLECVQILHVDWAKEGGGGVIVKGNPTNRSHKWKKYII